MRRAGGCCYATYLHVFPLLVMLPFPKRVPSRSQTLCPGRSLLPTFPFLEGIQPAVRRRTSPRPPQSSWAAGSDVGISTGKRAGAAYLASFLAHQEMLPHTLDGRAYGAASPGAQEKRQDMLPLLASPLKYLHRYLLPRTIEEAED